jgi:hypothetical protein
MTSELVRRARALRLLGASIAFAGLVPVVWFISRALIPAAKVLPEFGATWLPLQKITFIANPADIPFAVIGLVVMWAGASLATRQLEILAAEKRAAEDRQRRVRAYSDGGRIEPYIGSKINIEDDGPQEPR